MKLVFVTMRVNPAYLEAALNAAATGYVLKSAAREELLGAIKTVLNDPSQAAAAVRLSARELEILQLVAEGKSAKETAHVLNISIKTVAFHRDNIKRKLGLRTTAELTKHAIVQGLV